MGLFSKSKTQPKSDLTNPLNQAAIQRVMPINMATEDHDEEDRRIKKGINPLSLAFTRRALTEPMTIKECALFERLGFDLSTIKLSDGFYLIDIPQDNPNIYCNVVQQRCDWIGVNIYYKGYRFISVSQLPNGNGLSSAKCEEIELPEHSYELLKDQQVINQQKKQIKEFIKIYHALRDGQRGFELFKMNWLNSTDLLKMPPADAIKEIEKHSGKENSRSKTAWDLVKIHSGSCNSKNLALVHAISQASFAQSWPFKMSTSYGKRFFRASSLATHLSQGQLEVIDYKEKSHSARIVKRLT